MERMKALTDNERSALYQVLGSVLHCMYKNDKGEYQEGPDNFILTLEPKEMQAVLRAARKIGLDTERYNFKEMV